MKHGIIILVCCFSLFATTVYAENVIPDTTLFTGYEKEGEFVEIPARFGGIIGLPVGLVASLPIALVGAPFGKFEETYFTVGGYIIPQSFSFITGLPFYAAKKAFYDFPRTLNEKYGTMEEN